MAHFVVFGDFLEIALLNGAPGFLTEIGWHTEVDALAFPVKNTVSAQALNHIPIRYIPNHFQGHRTIFAKQLHIASPSEMILPNFGEMCI